ncbi:TrbG/VirB9 family P-type conjugative transfer protein [Sphingomonas sabuli]|uniref:TrbG/VirB9 family P-type conjugative transfer protein n=1 Tax=Sphingomonas sabuli TaxID=2764186 RepID=A0A7G9KZC4_9SPHN|nr:TrbG/VirB9 family P-type conjugative transfer protein [Sphingomonas sabuli]QNM81723.1 TrbG/VirB9 family P-type conjugative transfer protein [Sphingomonas sabuli]
MRRLLCILPLLALTAAQAPDPGSVNPHIQSVFYQPDQVVLLRGAIGWQITVEFGPDERIENVSIGDALAWQVTPNKKAKMLFLKPLIKGAATNMTVITDRRRYAFQLETGPRTDRTPWTVNFEYPREVVEAIEEPPPPPPAVLNFSYSVAGDATLRPARVWDDGQMTFFEFLPEQPMPAIFAGGPGKDETLVNSFMRGRTVVVQQRSGRFTLRSGERVATVTYGLGAKS